jgi:shikimate kinase
MVLNLPLSESNLILTGYTGPNQPVLGQRIAEQIRMPLVNIQTLIAERIGLSVDEIRSYYGETRLKTVEAEIMDETLLRRQTVIRISARTLLQGDYLDRLRKTGPVICLVTTLDAVLQRLHMSMGARYYNPYDRALELGELKREWAVRGQPGVHEIDTTYLSADQTIEQVISLWQGLAIERA